MAAVSDGEGETVLDATRPTLQGHAFGFGAQVGVGGPDRTAKTAKMDGCAVHANQGDKQAFVVAFNRDGKFLHVWRMPLCKQ